MEKMSIYAKSRYRYDSKDPVYKNTHSVIKAANIRFIFLTQNCSECGEEFNETRLTVFQLQEGGWPLCQNCCADLICEDSVEITK